jgi:DNA-binding CsgD family transcriptional regulator
MSSGTTDPQFIDDDRLLGTLERLMSLPAVELRPTLDETSTLVADALDVEKADLFLYDATSASLVALGTSDTPLGRRQHALGLDRLPRVNNDPLVRVFDTGEAYCTGHADDDPSQSRGNIESLGVRSQIGLALDVNGERRGVLAVVSTESDRFSTRDQRFLRAVAAWIGLLVHRAELVERRTSEATRRGQLATGEELARLTRRQQNVAACVAEGLTNDEISERLVITAGTVANHVEGILRRLELRNRASLATWAVEHGLHRSDRDEQLC